MALGIGIAAVLVVVSVLRARTRAESGRTCLVQRKSLARVIHERGRLVCARSTLVELAGSGVILSILEHGTPVKKGDTIVEVEPVVSQWFRSTPLRDALEELAASAEVCRIGRTAASAEYDLVAAERSNKVAVAREELAVAELEQEIELRGTADEERRIMQIQVELAAMDLEHARRELDRHRRLEAKGFVSSAAIEPYERRVTVAEAIHRERIMRFELASAGPRPQRSLELAQEVERLETVVELNEATTKRKLAEAQCKIDIPASQLAGVESEIRDVEEEFAGAVTKAPTNGILLLNKRQDWRLGGIWIEPRVGMQMYGRQAIANIVEPGKMNVELMVHESDMYSVTTGMAARVRAAALPGRVFSGRVAAVGGVGRDRYNLAARGVETELTGITMFNVTVGLEDADDADLRPDMSVSVELIVEPERERLVVPREAVGLSEGTYTVSRKTGFGVKKQPVEGEVLDDTYFLVRSGLHDGDTVVILDQDTP